METISLHLSIENELVGSSPILYWFVTVRSDVEQQQQLQQLERLPTSSSSSRSNKFGEFRTSKPGRQIQEPGS